MPRPKRGADVYVATTGFACLIDGEEVRVAQGERVRAGHSLLKTHAENFKAVDVDIDYDVEQATQAPGERRGEQ